MTHPFLKQVLNSTVVKIILIRYSSDGLLSKKEIGDIRVRGYKMVSIQTLPQKKYKSDNKRNNRSDKLEEYLFIFQKE